MAFMIPFYTQEAFVTVTDKHGESYSVPADYAGDAPDDCEKEFHPADKYWAHLSAPGYMDQTDWSGPYDTLREARDYIESCFDVDPDTGKDIGRVT
jgi:hypothetical protein